MEIVHGGLVIDVPAGWTDASSLLFVAPRVHDLPTKNAVDAPTETLSIRFAFAREEDSARSLLDGELASLRAVDKNARVLDEGEHASDLGAGWRQTLAVTIGGAPLRQIAVCIIAGPVAVLATATAGEARFALARPTLEAALTKLRRAREQAAESS
jgi:hypothetical protein